MSRYLDMVRSQKQKKGSFFTSKGLLMVLAIVAMFASAIYWWGIQKELTPSRIVAASYTIIMVLAPPCLVSFLIPWSPAGMLLQRIQARTWGYTVVVVCALILVYYSFVLQYQWWLAQPVAAQSGQVLWQVLIGLIGFIFIPALLWTPVNHDELSEQIRQAHLVRRYELQTQADIAILRNTLMHAQSQALIGFMNLTVQEKEELAAIMRGLVRGIDQTMNELSDSVRKVAGVSAPFTSLEDNEVIQDYLGYISDTLREAPPTEVAKRTPPAPQITTMATSGGSRNDTRNDTRTDHQNNQPKRNTSSGSSVNDRNSMFDDAPGPNRNAR